MYLILDTYGNRKVAWTRREAMEWLAACSPCAIICNRFTGRLLAARRIL